MWGYVGVPRLTDQSKRDDNNENCFDIKMTYKKHFEKLKNIKDFYQLIYKQSFTEIEWIKLFENFNGSIDTSQWANYDSTKTSDIAQIRIILSDWIKAVSIGMNTIRVERREPEWLRVLPTQFFLVTYNNGSNCDSDLNIVDIEGAKEHNKIIRKVSSKDFVLINLNKNMIYQKGVEYYYCIGNNIQCCDGSLPENKNDYNDYDDDGSGGDQLLLYDELCSNKKTSQVIHDTVSCLEGSYVICDLIAQYCESEYKQNFEALFRKFKKLYETYSKA